MTTPALEPAPINIRVRASETVIRTRVVENVIKPTTGKPVVLALSVETGI